MSNGVRLACCCIVALSLLWQHESSHFCCAPLLECYRSRMGLMSCRALYQPGTVGGEDLTVACLCIHTEVVRSGVISCIAVRCSATAGPQLWVESMLHRMRKACCVCDALLGGQCRLQIAGCSSCACIPIMAFCIPVDSTLMLGGYSLLLLDHSGIQQASSWRLPSTQSSM